MTARITLPMRDLLMVLGVTLLWGGNVVAVKMGTAALPPFLLTAMRFILVALALCPVYRADWSMLRKIAPIAVLMGIGHFGLLFLGLSKVDAATGAVVVQLGVPFSVLLSWLFLGDRLEAKKVVGLILAFGGIVVLAGTPGHADLIWVIVVAVSDLMWAVAMLLIKRTASIPPMVFNGWMALIATPFLLAASFLLESNQLASLETAPLSAWMGLLYTVICSSILAYGLWYGLLQRHPISYLVPYTLLAPVVAFVLGPLYLNETMTLPKIIGGILTVAGIAIIEIRGSKTIPEEPLV